MTSQNTEAGSEGKETPVTETPEFQAALKAEVSKATSTYQRSEARATREVASLKERVTGFEGQIAQLSGDLEIAKLAGDDPEALEQAKANIALKSEAEGAIRQAQELTRSANDLARSSTVVLLAAQYDLDPTELEGFETAEEMKGGAKDLYIKRLEDGKGKGSEEGSQQQQGQQQEQQEQKPGDGFEVGKGTAKVTIPNYVDQVLSGEEGRKAFLDGLAKRNRDAARR